MQAREEDLVSRARAGDREAMEGLFRLHVEGAVRLAYLVTSDWQAAEDAVQEAFVRAFGALRGFRDGASFKPWFTKIVVNQARRNFQKTRRLIPSAGVGEDLGYLEGQHRDQTLETERRVMVAAALDSLDEAHRTPIVLKYFADYSEQDIAETLNIPVSTVKSRLFVARRRLQEKLEGEGGETLHESL